MFMKTTLIIAMWLYITCDVLSVVSNDNMTHCAVDLSRLSGVKHPPLGRCL